MDFKNFPESNLPLGAGGNENTRAMRVMLCEHPDYAKGTLFFCSKWEFDPEEKYRLREKIFDAIMKYFDQEHEELKSRFIKEGGLMDAIMAEMPDIWLNIMHQPNPVSISMMPPEYFGYVKKQLKRPQDN
jgi:hypothetical protein